MLQLHDIVRVPPLYYCMALPPAYYFVCMLITSSSSANMYTGYDNDDDYDEDQQHNPSCNVSASYDDILGWNGLLLS